MHASSLIIIMYTQVIISHGDTIANVGLPEYYLFLIWGASYSYRLMMIIKLFIHDETPSLLSLNLCNQAPMEQ